MMDHLGMDAASSPRGNNGAGTFDHCPLLLTDPFIAKPEMGTRAQIAVEILHVVAPLPSGIQRTKIRLMYHHIVVPEPGDYLFIAQMRKPCNDRTVLPGVLNEPVVVGHGDPLMQAF